MRFIHDNWIHYWLLHVNPFWRSRSLQSLLSISYHTLLTMGGCINAPGTILIFMTILIIFRLFFLHDFYCHWFVGIIWWRETVGWFEGRSYFYSTILGLLQTLFCFCTDSLRIDLNFGLFLRFQCTLITVYFILLGLIFKRIFEDCFVRGFLLFSSCYRLLHFLIQFLILKIIFILVLTHTLLLFPLYLIYFLTLWRNRIFEHLLNVQAVKLVIYCHDIIQSVYFLHHTIYSRQYFVRRTGR